MKRASDVPLKVAAIVTPDHAKTFAEEWRTGSWATGVICEAFSATRLMEWPSNAGAGGQETPEELRYKEVEDEILNRMLDVLQPVIEAAFLQSASEVLDRERTLSRKRNVQE